MRGSSYIQTRPTGYYLRIRVPHHLRPVLGYEVVRSLSTVCLKFARYLAAKVAYHLNTLWESPTETRAMKDKTDALIAVVLQGVKEEDLLHRMLGLTEEEVAKASRRRREVEKSDPTIKGAI